ncbi:hypothetical protein HK405_014885 [Cladochytrium tenue]|nr:hypothetical protein HK405_014885 [Cladochytrium tenue]
MGAGTIHDGANDIELRSASYGGGNDDRPASWMSSSEALTSSPSAAVRQGSSCDSREDTASSVVMTPEAATTTLPATQASQAAAGKPQRPRLVGLRGAAAVAAVTGVSALNTFNSGMLTVALPSVAADLRIPAGLQLWPSSAYALAVGCALLVLGAAADTIGSRPVFLAGAASFALTTLACGLSANAAQLVAFRALQGVAMAACMPTAVSIVATGFEPGRARNMALAALGGGNPVGFALGLVLGGVFAQTTGWRAGFFVCAAINLALVVVAWIAIPRAAGDLTASRSGLAQAWARLAKGLDWVGISMASVCLALLSFVLS